jgi:hypothetical protein
LKRSSGDGTSATEPGRISVVAGNIVRLGHRSYGLLHCKSFSLDANRENIPGSMDFFFDAVTSWLGWHRHHDQTECFFDTA